MEAIRKQEFHTLDNVLRSANKIMPKLRDIRYEMFQKEYGFSDQENETKSYVFFTILNGYENIDN